METCQFKVVIDKKKGMCVSKIQFVPGPPGQSVGIQKALAVPLFSSYLIPLEGMLQDNILFDST